MQLCLWRFSGSLRVQGYVETIVHRCPDGGRALVSVVLLGSAAIGGWVETVSDVDLILVVPDCGTRRHPSYLAAAEAWQEATMKEGKEHGKS